MSDQFHTKTNFQKEFNSLIGVATGLIADNYITKQELDYFIAWSKEQHYASYIPNYHEMMIVANKAIENNSISEELCAQLAEYIAEAIEHKIVLDILSTTFEKNFSNRLIGFIRGVLADNHLNDAEIEALAKYVHDSDSVAFRKAQSIIDGIKDFKQIDEQTRTELKNELNAIIGGSVHEHGVIDGMTMGIEFDTLPKGFDLYCTRFVLTGNFYSMSRKQMGELIESFGATQSKSVSGTTDILIVGGMASKDWAFSSFGRKIEKALELREEQSHLLIVDEKQMADYLAGL